MIDNNCPTNTVEQQQVPVKSSRPNDVGALNIDEHVRIFDPNSEEILLEKRA
jgi:hypothetical protein